MKKYLRSTMYKNSLFSKALANRARRMRRKGHYGVVQTEQQFFIAG